MVSKKKFRNAWGREYGLVRVEKKEEDFRHSGGEGGAIVAEACSESREKCQKDVSEEVILYIGRNSFISKKSGLREEGRFHRDETEEDQGPIFLSQGRVLRT